MPYIEGCGCDPCTRARMRGESPMLNNPRSSPYPSTRFAVQVDLSTDGDTVWRPLDHEVDLQDQTTEDSATFPQSCVVCGREYDVSLTVRGIRCRYHRDREDIGRCQFCGDRHPYEEDRCVSCVNCEQGRGDGSHTHPTCCQPLDTGPVFCNRCNGTHSGPPCDIETESGCGSCRNCNSISNIIYDRGRNRRYGRPGGGYVFNYSYVPEPLVFRGEGPFYFGMELETEVNDLRTNVSSAASVATEQLGELGYLKEDGSIDYGFEIVTHPMSYQYFVDHYPWAMLESLKDMGCRTTRGTGIHVHVSKNAFTPVHAYKWLKWWYRNQEQVEVFARRESSQWAAFGREERSRVKYYCKGDNRTGADGQRALYGPNRYSAVNVRPANTYEVRVFRSSLSPRIARATLGLVAATVDYAREITPRQIAKDAAWEWPAFGKWVKAHSAQYPDLIREITRVNQKIGGS